MTDSLLAARERKGAPVSRPRAGRDGAGWHSAAAPDSGPYGIDSEIENPQ